MTTRSVLAVAFALALAACSKSNTEDKTAAGAGSGGNNKAEGPGAPSAGSAAPALQPAPQQTDALSYTVPPAWRSAPNPSPMRKATFMVPHAGGDAQDAELSVSTAGGAVDANIDRWAHQFGNATPAKEQRSPNGLKVTVVSLSGTYTAGGMMGAPEPPKPHWALLGAIVDLGGTLYFFKLTGPEQTVNATKADFDAFVASFRAK